MYRFQLPEIHLPRRPTFRYTPLYERPRCARLRWRAVACVCLVLLACVGLACFLLRYFGVFDVLPYLVAVWDFFYNLITGTHPLVVPSCPGVVGLAFSLVYSPDSNNVVDTSGLGCVVQASQPSINAQGNDAEIGPFYNGQTSFAFDLPGCTSYTWIQWLRVDDGVQVNSRFMNLDAAFPLMAWIYGQGFVIFSAFTKALPIAEFVHVTIVYDETTPSNAYYFDGQLARSDYPSTHPPARAYMSATMSFVALPGVYFGPSRMFCHAMSASEVMADFQDFQRPSRMPAVYPALGGSPPSPLPKSFTFPFSADTNPYHSFFGEFPTQASDAAIPRSLNRNYVTVLIDQVNGNDATGDGVTSQWASTENLAIFGNLGYVYAVLTASTMFHNGMMTGDLQFPDGATQPTFAQGALPSGCNAWYFNNANTGQVVTPVSTRSPGGVIYYSGMQFYHVIDATISLWINLQSVTGSPTVSLGTYNSPNAAQFFRAQAYDSTHYQLVMQPFDNPVQVTLVLPYNQFHYISFTWNCALGMAAAYVDGQLRTSLININACPANMVDMGALIMSDGSANTFTGYMGAQTVHLVSLSSSAIGALYRLMNSGKMCSIVETCLALRFCGNDVYYSSPGIQLLQSTLDGMCPVSINTQDCGRGTNWAQIHGEAILPQTPTIGWQPTAYVSSTGVTHPDALMYDLHYLYTLTGTAFLRSDPLALAAGNYAPTNMLLSSGPVSASSDYGLIVGGGSLAVSPRAPNIDTPRYPFGHKSIHTMRTLSYLTDGGDFAGSGQTPQYPPSYYAQNNHWMPTPGDWCNATWNQMFLKNTVAYMDFFVNNFANAQALFSRARVGNLAFTYQEVYPQPFSLYITGGAANIIDCELWMSEVAAPLGYDWTNPQIKLLGVPSANFDKPQYAIPQCHGVACLHFTEFYMEIDPPPDDMAPPPFTPNPTGRAAGGWLDTSSAYLFGGDDLLFDGPCEFYYQKATGRMWHIPCNDTHRALLLDTSSGLGLNPIAIAQSPGAVAGWARVIDLNSGVGLSVGYNLWHIMQDSSPVQGIISGVEVSGFNKFGIYVETRLPSRIQGVALSNNLNHIMMRNKEGHGFIIDASGANTTRVWYGWNMDADGVGVSCSSLTPSATCNVLDSAFVTTIGSSGANFIRNVEFVDNTGQTLLTASSSKFWIEHCTFNLTEQFVGDAGVIYTSPSPQVLLYTTFDGLVVSSSTDLDLQPSFVYGAYSAGSKRDAYMYGSPMMVHGCKFLNVVGDVVALVDVTSGYDDPVNFYQLTSTLITGSSWTIWQQSTLQMPTSQPGSRGRPFGIQNLALIFDGVQTVPYVQISDYPFYGPGFQGAPAMWRWGDTIMADGLSFVTDTQICYAMIEYSGDPNTKPLLAQLSPTPATGLSSPTAYGIATDNALRDWDSATSNGNNPVGFGASHCGQVKKEFATEIDNEANYHYAQTQPVVMAIARMQIPGLWLESFGQPSPTGARDWKTSMNAWNPSSPWPDELQDFSQTQLLTHITVNPVTGQFYDTQGVAQIVYQGFNGLAQFPAADPSYVGSSYDPQRGLVMDAQYAKGLSWSLSYPDLYYQFTLSWWMNVATLESLFTFVNINRNDGVLLNMGGMRGNDLGGTISMQGQGYQGSGGTGTPFMWNNNNRACWFDVDVSTGASTGRSNIDKWVHYTAVVSQDYQYTTLYVDGQPKCKCATMVSGGVPIRPFYGGTMLFLSQVSARIQHFQVFAGAMSASAVMGLYQSSANEFDGPTSFPVIGTSKVIDLTWSGTTFVISPTESTWTVASLNQQFRLTAPQAPDGSSTVVIDPQAQFSFPVPPSLLTWTLQLVVWWSSPPTAQPWFSWSSNVMNADHNTGLCLLTGVGPLNVDTDTINAQGVLCIPNAPFPLNQWTTYTFLFDSTQGVASLYVNGISYGSFGSSLVGQITTSMVLSFSVTTQVYMAINPSTLNGGYIRTLQVYRSLLY